MKLRHQIQRRHRNGSAILVLLMLLSVAALLAVSNHMALRHLYGELKLLETHQQKKYTPPARVVSTNGVTVSPFAGSNTNASPVLHLDPGSNRVSGLPIHRP